MVAHSASAATPTIIASWEGKISCELSLEVRARSAALRDRYGSVRPDFNFRITENITLG